MEESPIRQHLLLNSERLSSWKAVKEEVPNIRRAWAATEGAGRGAAPMDIGAFDKGKGPGGKGGKGKETRTCRNCGRVGHIATHCWAPGGGAHQPHQQQKGGGDGGKGKKGKTMGKKGGSNVGGGGGKGAGKGRACWRCGQTGHMQAQCPHRQQQVHALGQQVQPQQQQQMQAPAPQAMVP